jgi:hypothetical protein
MRTMQHALVLTRRLYCPFILVKEKEGVSVFDLDATGTELCG